MVGGIKEHMQVDSKVGREAGARDRDMADHEVIV